MLHYSLLCAERTLPFFQGPIVHTKKKRTEMHGGFAAPNSTGLALELLVY